MKMKIALKRVSWDKALTSLEEYYRKDKQWKWKCMEAEASSLSALFINDFSKATRRIARAMEIEPFNPLHRYRLALLHMRFAQWDEALSILDALGNLLPGVVFPLYLRALVFLRTEQLKRAANIAIEIGKIKPGFTWAIFLGAEAQIRQKFKGAEGFFRELPKGERFLGIWVDLLVKTIVAHPSQGAKLVGGLLIRSKLLPKNSLEEKLIAQVIEWSSSSSSKMREFLEKIPADSKTEQFALLFFYDSLKNNTEKFSYINELKYLYEIFPNRSSIRRLYIATLNRYAVEEAAAENYQSALSFVETCLRLEPFNMIHYQNRATLFTLLRKRNSYYRAWEDLDRQSYRLALLGRIDPQITRLIAKRHRMFAQQARLTQKSPDAKNTENPGVFKEERTRVNVVEETILGVNQEYINKDPEQLRQWIHHRKAELFFSHLALSSDPDLFLLGYGDDFSARTKLGGLVLLGQSLPVLAGEEGQLLAQHVEMRWRELVGKSSPSLSRKEENSEVRLLKNIHIETLGDLAMLCYCWQPKASDIEIVYELIEFIEAEVPFLDRQTLFSSKKNREEEPYSIIYLRQAVFDALDLEVLKSELSDQERKKVCRHLTNYLNLHLSYRIFEEYIANPKDAARRALEILENIRWEISDNPEITFGAAYFFYHGDFYKEARKAISRFHKVNKKHESPYIARIKEIQNAIDKAGEGNIKDYIASKCNIRYSANRSVSQQINNYKAELEGGSSSIQIYEDLIHLLAFEGHFKEALAWSERALDRCLSRKGQLKPRMLHIEVSGLQILGSKYLDEIKLYLSGVISPLKEALEQILGEEPVQYELLYLQGICLMEEGDPHHAQTFFQKALEKCNNQYHLVLLRVFSSDVENTFYTIVKESIQQFTTDRLFDRAFEYIDRVIQKMKTPELMIIELADVQLAAVAAKLKYESIISKIPSMTISASWNKKLNEIIHEPDDLEKVLLLTLLAMNVHEPSKERGQEILQQIDEMKIQLDIANSLTLSGQYCQDNNFQESLRILDLLGEKGDHEPQVLQLRAKVLLKLEKFEQADQVVACLESFDDPLIKTFIMGYPSLKFQHKISKAKCLLRKGKSTNALEILDTLRPVVMAEQLETIYCYAFDLAVKGYRARLEGDHNETVRFFNDALERLEPKIKMARQSNHNGLLELYEKLSKEPGKLQEEMHESE